MTTYEAIALVISVISLLATVINIVNYFRLTREYNGIAKEQYKIDQGQAETSIRGMIMAARQNVESISEKAAVHGNLTDDDNEIYEKMFDSAEENLRNAYEEACSRYLDGKVDKERFRRMYYFEIQQLVSDPKQKEIYDSVSTKYECTVKVYKEWFNLEQDKS